MIEKPNILLIMADQLVPFLTGAYGHPLVQTPNLDRLAAGGIRFDSAYTPYPLCAPARVAMLTGRYASRIGCFDNAALFPAEQPTLAHYLTNAGYDTVLSGKMHFIGPDQMHGFGKRLTTDIFPANIVWVPAPTGVEQGEHAKSYVLPNVGVRSWTKYLAYDEETQFHALEYLRNRRFLRQSGPFFLTVSFHHPHDPFHVTQELWDQYEGKPIEFPEIPENLDETYSELDRWINAVHGVEEVDLRHPDNLKALRRAYYGLVTYVDRNVGELLSTLEETGQRQNTIIIFTSDHGDMLGEKGMVQKRCFYEWSARIPLIFQFPDGQGAGRRVSAPVSLLDFLPTLLDLAGVPEAERLPVEGQSMSEILAGAEDLERAIFSEYHVEKVKSPSFMIRRGKYKYVYVHRYGRQLFDLEADPGEWRNLSGGPALKDIESSREAAILARFDPESLAKAGLESVQRRLIIRETLRRNEVHWDYIPTFDPTGKYVR
jgi:choline-sulfatase